MSGVVEYLVSIRGMVDKSIEQAMKAIGASASTMAKQVNAAEAAIQRSGRVGATAMNAHSRAALDAARANELYYKSAARIEKMQVAMLERAQAKKGLIDSGMMPPPGGKTSLWQRGVEAWMGYHLAKGVLHGVDSAISKAGDVDALREKMKYALGGDTATVDRAYAKAFDLSGKYRNTSVEENLKIIDDLRANLPEHMDKIIGEAAEPFVKMHGFFKAWEGGKHAGHAEKALGDISAAIRAGELTGNLTSDLLNQHTQSLAVARVLFGDKFKVQQYFQGTQLAATALSAADRTFQYVDFPVLMQRLSSGGATSLATAFQKLIGGTRVSQGMAENWRALGLVDMNQVMLNKDKIVASQLSGRAWLKDSNAYANNLTDALMTKVVPALEKTGKVARLPGQELAKAWKAGDVDKITHLMEMFRKDPRNMADLTRAMTGLGYDRNAAKAMEEIVIGSASILRDRERALQILKEFENYQSYDKAKQGIASQANRFWLALTGKEFTPWVTKNLDKVSDGFKRLGDAVNSNPALRSGIKWAAVGTGALMAAGALRALATYTGLSGGLALAWAGVGKLAGGLARVVKWGGRLRMLTGIGAALTIGAAVWQNWDKLAASFERIAKSSDKIKAIGAEFDRLGKAAQETEAGKAVRNALNLDMDIKGGKRDFDPMFSGAGQWNNRYSDWIARNYRNPAMVGGPGFGDDVRRFWNNGSTPGQNVANAQAQRVQVESRVQVQTHFDPVQIQPGTLTINYNGPIGGPGGVAVNGTGGHPRGEAMPATSSTAQ